MPEQNAATRSPEPIRLVLLPGLDGTGILFEPFLTALPALLQPQVIAYPPDRHLDYSALASLVLRSLPKQERFVLLGESFSGPVAVMAAAQRPAGLAAVVLCASFVKSPARYLPRWTRVFAQPFAFRCFPLFAQLKVLFGGYSTKTLRGIFRKAHAMVSPTVMAARVRAVLAVDVSAELQACAVPILYLAGSDDHVVPRHNLQAIRALKPDVRIATIAAPHPVLQVRPVEAARAITAFVQAVALI